MHTNPRAAAYLRVSTPTQAKEGLSLEDQERQIRKHAEGNDWELLPPYVERGVSGRKAHRPQLDRMVADAEAGRFDFLIVNRLDRLGRNNRNLHNLLHRIERANVKFVCLNPPIDTSTSAGRFLLGMFAALAELESDLIAERIKPIIKGSAENGRHHARPPFGYETRDKQLVPHPQQAPIVRRIFEEKAAGESQRAMAGRLNGEGIKTATGASFDPSNIGKILKNRVYVGMIESNGDVFQGQHDAIIDDELWQTVETLRDANKASAGNGRGRVPAKHLFVRGHLRCGLCGNSMVPRTKGRNAYYQCLTRKDSGIDACAQRNVPRRVVDEAAWDYFEVAGIDQDATRRRELAAFDAQQSEAAARLKAARKAAKDAVANRARVKRQVKTGAITLAAWQHEWKDELDAEIAETEALVAELELAAEDVAPLLSDHDAVLMRLGKIRAAVQGWRDSQENIAAARAAIRRTFESFTIAPAEDARIPTVEDMSRNLPALREAGLEEEVIAASLASVREWQQGKRQRWHIFPEPRAEVLDGAGVVYQPVLKAAGHNGSLPMLTAWRFCWSAVSHSRHSSRPSIPTRRPRCM